MKAFVATRPPFSLVQRSLFLVPLLALAGSPATAYAHKLKVFATVEAGQVRGYAFFIAGGRAADANWRSTVEGRALASGRTDEDGRFAFAAPVPPGDTDVIVDTGEGHAAWARLPASRFGAPAPLTGAAAAVPAPKPWRISEPPDAAPIEAAVQRQIAPLMERIEEMDSRLRLTDVVSGVCFILGLGGMALWALGRRRA